MALTATDINPGMLDYAQGKLKDLKGIDWQEADIANLPFLDASFTGAACQFGLMFVPDNHRAFREMRRVLIKGSLLAVSVVWDRMEANPWGAAVHATVTNFFPDTPPQFFKALFNSADVDVLRRMLTTNGFDKIEVQTVPMECRSSSTKSLAIGMIEGVPRLAEIEERRGSPGPIVDAVAATFTWLGGDRPFRSTMQAIVATARASG